MKLIVATDSKFFGEALRFILDPLADRVDVASSPEEVMELLKENDHDVIMCDLACENGAKSAEKIKRLKPKAKVILFSFDPPNRHAELIGEVGADGYINRPLDPEAVIESLNALKQN